jgi:hypothetical protein
MLVWQALSVSLAHYDQALEEQDFWICSKPVYYSQAANIQR